MAKTAPKNEEVGLVSVAKRLKTAVIGAFRDIFEISQV